MGNCEYGQIAKHTFVEGHRRNVAMRFGMNFSILSLMVICNQ